MPLNVLFNQHNIFDVLRNQEQKVREYVQKMPRDKLLGASEQDLIGALIEEFQLNVPVLKEDKIDIADHGETQVDVPIDPTTYGGSRPPSVPGQWIVVAIPFEGEAEFFRVQPQVFGAALPRAEITNCELRLTYVRTDHDGESVKRSYEQAVSNIKLYLDSLTESARRFNSGLEGLVTTAIKERKDRLLANAGMLKAIGLSLRKREGMPMTYAIPIKRRVAKIEQIKVQGAFKPEPTLSHSDYEAILRIMKNMALVMESSPRAFVDLGEEMLRWHFLVQLNGVYEGQATGETFNFQGKTDVLIRVDGRSVFIAECKFWKGEKSLLETIDQLLKYLSWRDTKAAVVVFNTNANFSDVLAKILEIVPKHPNCKRELGKPDESTFRYVFTQPTDQNREITLTVLAFDIPKAVPEASPKPANT